MDIEKRIDRIFRIIGIDDKPNSTIILSDEGLHSIIKAVRLEVKHPKDILLYDAIIHTALRKRCFFGFDYLCNDKLKNIKKAFLEIVVDLNSTNV